MAPAGAATFTEPYGQFANETARWEYAIEKGTLTVSYWPRSPHEGFSDRYILRRSLHGTWTMHLDQESFDQGMRIAKLHVGAIFKTWEEKKATAEEEEQEAYSFMLRMRQRRVVTLMAGIRGRSVPSNHVETLEQCAHMLPPGNRS